MTENQTHEIAQNPVYQYFGKRSEMFQEDRKKAKTAVETGDSAFQELDLKTLHNRVSMYHEYKNVLTEEMKDTSEYQDASETVKTIKKAEMERIKPEKAFQELALVLINLYETQGSVTLDEYKNEYKKAMKHSSKEYCQEFIQKTTQELKEYCIQFESKKAAVKKELENNTEYTTALKVVEGFKNEIKYLLKEMLKASKMALQEINKRCEQEAQKKSQSEG